MAQEQKSGVDQAVHATKLAANLGTGQFGKAAMTAISDPGQTLAVIKNVLAVAIFIVMVPVLIAASIPTSILSLVSINTSSSKSDTEAIAAQYDSFYNAFEDVLKDSAGEATGKVKVNMCLMISYFSAYCEKQTPEIDSKDQVKEFKSKLKDAKLISTKKGKKSTKVTFKGEKAFAKYLGLTKKEREACEAKSSVLAQIINKDEVVSFDMSDVTDDASDDSASYEGGKTYKLTKEQMNIICKIVAQEDSTCYEGALAVISHMCNMTEYSDDPQYKGKPLFQIATSNWYGSYKNGAYKKRHPSKFVVKAVKDALNGKRNIPPYVLEFGRLGTRPYNYDYDKGSRFYKDIGDNSYCYTIQDKQRLKKATAAYEKAGSVGSIVYYCQGDYGQSFSGPGGTNTIATAGCGPTSMAICISTLTRRKVTPVQVSRWGAKQGLYVQNDGWDHSCPRIMAEHWGLKCKNIPRTKKALKAALKKGQLVVAVMGPGHFTLKGHFIVLYGLDSSGKILVSDCGKRARNGAWNFDIVFNETKDGYWQIYK